MLKRIIFILSLVVMGLVFMKLLKYLPAYRVMNFKAETYSTKEFSRSLNYRLFTPNNVEKKKLPLVVYLHYCGNNGCDNRAQVNTLIFPWSQKKSQSKFPCYIFAPQCPSGREWVDKEESNKPPFHHYDQNANPETEEMKMIVEVIDELVKTKSIDPSRIYVIGYSMGATGCWDILTRYPDLFAGSIIASGVSDITKASKLVNVPIWAFSGGMDNIAPPELNQEMVNEINNSGGHAIFELLADKDHGVGEVVNLRQVKEWLFNQKKEVNVISAY